jgi:hypothetical protein
MLLNEYLKITKISETDMCCFMYGIPNNGFANISASLKNGRLIRKPAPVSVAYASLPPTETLRPI